MDAPTPARDSHLEPADAAQKSSNKSASCHQSAHRPRETIVANFSNKASTIATMIQPSAPKWRSFTAIVKMSLLIIIKLFSNLLVDTAFSHSTSTNQSKTICSRRVSFRISIIRWVVYRLIVWMKLILSKIGIILRSWVMIGRSRWRVLISKTTYSNNKIKKSANLSSKTTTNPKKMHKMSIDSSKVPFLVSKVRMLIANQPIHTTYVSICSS